MIEACVYILQATEEIGPGETQPDCLQCLIAHPPQITGILFGIEDRKESVSPLLIGVPLDVLSRYYCPGKENRTIQFTHLISYVFTPVEG